MIYTLGWRNTLSRKFQDYGIGVSYGGSTLPRAYQATGKTVSIFASSTSNSSGVPNVWRTLCPIAAPAQVLKLCHCLYCSSTSGALLATVFYAYPAWPFSLKTSLQIAFLNVKTHSLIKVISSFYTNWNS